MEIEFHQAIPILQKIIERGYLAYFVGGSVRDYLLGRKIHDVDIATSATPKEIMGIFPKTVPVGIQHGTVMVLEGQGAYEITTFRSEKDYEDFRRPSNVQFVRSLEEDIKRRDFTINAMAMTVSGEIIDLFGGQEDLAKKIIRTVGEPSERFSEDALRMMRALRFASTLGFTIEEKTVQAITQLSPLLSHISVERITAEFEKLLMGANVNKALPLFITTDLVQFLPKMTNGVAKLAEYHMTELSLVERWTLLLLILKVKEPLPFLKAWKLPTKQMQEISQILGAVHEEWTKVKMYRLGGQILQSAEKVRATFCHEVSNHQKLMEKYIALPIKSRKDLAITGTDLLLWLERKSGSWVSQYLQKIEEEILVGILENNRKDIKELVLSWEK